MDDLRRRVAEKKARGLYGVDALMAASTEGADAPFGLDELESLRDLAVQRVEIDAAASTKPLVGGAVSRLKRLLVRGASQPMYGMSAQATAFNGALLAYLSSLAREVSALERRVRAEHEAAEAARDELERVRQELARVVATAESARAATERLADAALPERVARLERGGEPAAAAAHGPAAAAAPGSLRLRLEATEPDGGREARWDALAGDFAGRAVLHLGAGSGRALERLGPRAVGVEADPALAAAAEAAGRAVVNADPVTHLASLGAGSVEAILVSDLVERLDGPGLAALAGGLAHALAGDGVVVVEAHHPDGVDRDGSFWRDPERLRPLHPDAVRMALESAGLAATGVTLHPSPADEPGGPRHYAVHATR